MCVDIPLSGKSFPAPRRRAAATRCPDGKSLLPHFRRDRQAVHANAVHGALGRRGNVEP
jgi:hypothetical protein